MARYLMKYGESTYPMKYGQSTYPGKLPSISNNPYKNLINAEYNSNNNSENKIRNNVSRLMMMPGRPTLPKEYENMHSENQYSNNLKKIKINHDFSFCIKYLSKTTDSINPISFTFITDSHDSTFHVTFRISDHSIFLQYIRKNIEIYNQTFYIDQENYNYMLERCYGSPLQNGVLIIRALDSKKNFYTEKYDKISNDDRIETSNFDGYCVINLYDYHLPDEKKKNIAKVDFILSDIRNINKIFHGGKKSPVKKRTVKKSPVKKRTVKKSPVKKSPVKKSPVKKSPAKKSPAKKSPAKKRTVKK
jgi:hypothetical protein